MWQISIRLPSSLAAARVSSLHARGPVLTWHIRRCRREFGARGPADVNSIAKRI